MMVREGFSEMIFKLKSIKKRKKHLKELCKEDRKNKALWLERAVSTVWDLTNGLCNRKVVKKGGR